MGICHSTTEEYENYERGYEEHHDDYGKPLYYVAGLMDPPHIVENLFNITTSWLLGTFLMFSTDTNNFLTNLITFYNL